MLSNYLIHHHPLPILSSNFPSNRVFPNELAHHIMWPKYWCFNFSISPSNEYSGLISLGLTGLISLLSKRLSRVFSSITIRKHQIVWYSAFCMFQLSHPYMTIEKTIALSILTFVGKVMSLLRKTLSSFVVAFLPRSKRLLISLLQSLQ